jgi:hypothetical protein
MFSLIFSLHIGVMDLYCKKLIQYQNTRFSLKFQEIQKTFSKNSHFKKQIQKICFYRCAYNKVSQKYKKLYRISIQNLKNNNMYLHAFLDLITSLLKS